MFSWTIFNHFQARHKLIKQKEWTNVVWSSKMSLKLKNMMGDIGRGHTNYDIQIIVVILKVTTRCFNNDLGLLEKLSW